MYSDLLKIQDYKGRGIITAHCNLDKLNTSINFSRDFKLDELLCYGFVADIIEKWREINALEPDPETNIIVIPDDLKDYYDLIFGAEFIDCNDKVKHQQGIKLLWIYYSYAEYVRINPLDDTPNGLAIKSNEFSMPPTVGDINTFAFKYDNMAKTVYHNIKEYLCINKDLFPKFDDCDCRLNCGCSGTCSCGKIKKVTGFKFRTVKRK